MSRQGKALMTARTADKFKIYQHTVQSAEIARWLTQRFRILTGRPPRVFREDFCGTAFNCCEFVKLHRRNFAIGIDMDESALRWCLQHNYPGLTESQWERITLVKGNVLSVETPKADLIAALNYSYGVFKRRKDLLAYLKNARRALVKGGVLLLQAHGGPKIEKPERRDFGDFSYICEEEGFDPITHDIRLRIHYAFRDGSTRRNAFVYDFRLWTLPELQELLLEAGLRNIHVLWPYQKNNVPGIFFRRTSRSRQAFSLWIAYVVGQA